MALTRVKKVPTANLVQGSSFLTSASSLAAARFPAGTVIQTVFDTHDTQVSTNQNGSYIDTGLEATITPTSASNKILVSVFQNGVYKDGSAVAGMQLRLERSGTVISQLAKRAGGDNGSGTAATMSIGTVGNQVLDSPNTTSAITYKTSFISASNAATVYVQVYTCDSTIILQEIKV
tara:strand:+ start:399 stop:929 length:531 start_codon:yes stop_codon:yes gene_type:complete